MTSNGSASGSALLWIVWNPDETGDGAELRAYDVLPVDSLLTLRWSAPVGRGTKFSPPGIAANRLYVGTDAKDIGQGLLHTARCRGDLLTSCDHHWPPEASDLDAARIWIRHYETHIIRYGSISHSAAFGISAPESPRCSYRNPQ